MTKKEFAFFNICKNISTFSDHPQCRIGAIITLRKRVISTGYNSITKCCSTQAKLDKIRFSAYSPGKQHAEVAALDWLVKHHADLNKAELYVYREHKDGSLSMSRPCQSCMALIRKAGIRKIHYTTNDGYADECVIYE